MTVTTTTDLTGAEKRALRAYKAVEKKIGMPPDPIDVGERMGVTRQRAAFLMKNLVAKGWLVKLDSRYRGYRLARKVAA